MRMTALAALALLTLTAAPAAAAGDSQFTHECYYDAVAVPDGRVGEPETYTARMGVQTVVYSLSGAPVSATVTCTLMVEGAVAHVATFSGTTLVAGSEQTTFASNAQTLDVVACTTVDFGDDTPTWSECPYYTQPEYPPSDLYDLANDVLATVPGLPALFCSAVRALDAGVPDVWGTFTISDSGRIFVGGYSNGWDTCAAPPGSSSTYAGGCGFEEATDKTWLVGERDRYTGVRYAAVVLSPPTVGATVTCTMRVNGEPVSSASFSGTGVVVGAAPYSYVAEPLDYVSYCETVDFTDSTPTSHWCYEVDPTQVPPQEVLDLLDAVVDLVPGARAAVCAGLRGVPDVGSLVTTGDDGDLDVNGVRVWDCR